MNTYVAILIGILIGWLTKVPVLLKLYKKAEKNEQHAKSLYDRALDLYLEKDEKNS